jgi:Zn-dependent protease
VSATPTQAIQICKACGQSLSSVVLACPQCSALVHAEELERLAAEAKELEAKGELRQARELWLKGLPLLPRASTQADWIRAHARALEQTAEMADGRPSDNKWAKRLGPLAPVAVLLAKSKALFGAIFKLKFLLSLAAFVAVYWALYGMKFGIGFTALILIHEMGHFIEIKRRGLPAEMPVFLPGLGAYVGWRALGVSPETRAEVSLAGPLAGLLAAAGCAAWWWTTGDGLWAALAQASAWLNVLNLIPVWALDGGQAALALSKTQRLILLTASLLMWTVWGEGIFFLVAAGAGWRMFTRDAPLNASPRITVYFIFILFALGSVIWFVPKQGPWGG